MMCTKRSYKVGLSVDVLDKLGIDDELWLKARDEKIFSLISYLLEKDNKRFRFVRVLVQDIVVITYLLDLHRLHPKKYLSDKKGILSCFTNKILTKCAFMTAHSTWLVMYDNNLTLFDDKYFVNNNKFVSLAESLALVGKKLNIRLLSFPVNRALSSQSQAKLSALGFHTYVSDFTMELIVNDSWHCFDDYLSSLRTKYYKRALGILKRGSTLTYRAMDLEEIHCREEQLYQLYMSVLQKQRFYSGVAYEDHFSMLKSIYNDNFVVEGVFDGECLLAFLTYFKKDGGLLIHFVGFDYANNEKYSLYFNLLFRCIDLGIGMESKYINFGRTSLDAKANLGAVAKEQSIFVRTNGLVSSLRTYLVSYFSDLEGQSWKQRRALK
ncbi:hypothetical protein AwDysgo_05320 [Bacteroidales bacterium]|nr:hypothetical protein AwDysgo_05320 [Bacteroidales bacterium]